MLMDNWYLEYWIAVRKPLESAWDFCPRLERFRCERWFDAPEWIQKIALIVFRVFFLHPMRVRFRFSRWTNHSQVWLAVLHLFLADRRHSIFFFKVSSARPVRFFIHLARWCRWQCCHHSVTVSGFSSYRGVLNPKSEIESQRERESHANLE